MPWDISYWLEAEKWMPAYWPPYEWMTRQPPFQPMQMPEPPAGYNGPWWFLPKDQWPNSYRTPWEPKVFGAFTARKVTMWPENLTNPPPFGTIKVKTPTNPDSPNALTPIKVHMRQQAWLDVSPRPSLWNHEKLTVELREMSRRRPVKVITDEGSITLKSMKKKGRRWTTEDYFGLAAAMKLNEYSISFPDYPWIEPVAPFRDWDRSNPTG